MRNFTAIPNELLDDPSVKDWKVIAAMTGVMRYANRQSAISRASHIKMAAAARISVDSLERGIAVLIEAGHLVKQGKKGRSHVYFVPFLKDEKPQESGTHSPLTADNEEPGHEVDSPLTADNIVRSQRTFKVLEDYVQEETSLSPNGTTSNNASEPEVIEPRASEEREAQEESEGVEEYVSERDRASIRATLDRAIPLSRQFRPSKYGYSATAFSLDYPNLDAGEVLEAFFSHHISKGDTSRNWLERFFSFASNAERIKRERKSQEIEGEDSMGYPLDPEKRRKATGGSRIKNFPPDQQEMILEHQKITKHLNNLAYDRESGPDEKAEQQLEAWRERVGRSGFAAYEAWSQAETALTPTEWLRSALEAVFVAPGPLPAPPAD